MKPKDLWVLEVLKAHAYEITSSGEVWKLNKSGQVAPRRRLKVHVHPRTGYVYFTMSFKNHQKSVLLHRVVALAHVPNPDDLPDVNHLDGRKTNCAAVNLEWTSKGDNERHAYALGLKTRKGASNSRAKLTESEVLAIRARHAEPHRLLAVEFGVSAASIHDIWSRRSWSHI